MYQKLNEKQIERIREIVEITKTNYELEKKFIPVDSFFSIIEDLLSEYYKIKEDFESLEEKVETNYKQISNDEMYQ